MEVIRTFPAGEKIVGITTVKFQPTDPTKAPREVVVVATEHSVYLLRPDEPGLNLVTLGEGSLVEGAK